MNFLKEITPLLRVGLVTIDEPPNHGRVLNDGLFVQRVLLAAVHFRSIFLLLGIVPGSGQSFTSISKGLDPNVHCMPRGAPRIWTDDYYKRIFQVPGRVIILTERNMQYRQIFTDGRPFESDPNPTWNGYSVGHWDGDTLVVETRGYRDGLWLDASGKPLTDQAKTIERIRRPNYGNLEVEITVDDPKAYTAPWAVKIDQPLVLDSELLDYYCLENE